jgi:hypothetical protein
LNNPAVAIKNIEQAIVDKGFEEGWDHDKPNRSTQESSYQQDNLSLIDKKARHNPYILHLVLASVLCAQTRKWQ